MVCALTLFAVRAFPLWDDGQTLLEAQRGGGQAVFESMPDRPVLGRIMSLMVDSGHLIAVSAAIFWLTWFGAGWVTMRLWKIVFPSHPRFALPAACLAIAPVIYQLQTVLVNPTLAAMVGPVLTWLVLLKFLEPRADDSSAARVLALHVVMIGVVAASAIISEYVLPTVIAGAVLLASIAPRPAGRPKQIWITIGLLLLTAAASYAVYHHLGNAQSRPEVRPELLNWAWRLTVLVPRWLTATWEASLGAVLKRIGAIDVSGSKEMFFALFAGIAGALVLGWISRQYADDSSTAERSESGSLRIHLTMLLAISAGVLPMVAMGAVVGTWSGTRFWSSLLPLESCFGVSMLSLLLRRRLLALLPAFCGMLAGYCIVNDGLLAIRERQHVVQIGDRLESSVLDDGLTVAFVSWDWKYPPRRAPDETEINARLTFHWPQAKREHFWAYAGNGPTLRGVADASRNLRISVLMDLFGRNPRLSRPWLRSIEATGKAAIERSEAGGRVATLQTSPPESEAITRLLWVTEGSDGKLDVEPMALSRAGAP